MFYWIKKLILKLRITFVTDCPRCFRYFSGFHSYGTKLTLEIPYRIVCHVCAREHEQKQIGA